MSEGLTKARCAVCSWPLSTHGNGLPCEQAGAVATPAGSRLTLAKRLKDVCRRRADIVCGLITAAACDKLDAERDSLIDQLAGAEAMASTTAPTLVDRDTPESLAEAFIKDAISAAPEPARELGRLLASWLDEDRWATAERLLLALNGPPAGFNHWLSMARKADAATQERDQAMLLVDDAREQGAHAARSGVQLVSAGFDDLPFEGCPEAWGEKPFARIAWFAEAGDPSVGESSRSGWTLAPDQAGTVVGDLVAISADLPKLHPATAHLIARFSRALADKLAAAEKKYGFSDGWTDRAAVDAMREDLWNHLDKGDPRDVAAYCAFLWHHGASTKLPLAQAEPRPGLAWGLFLNARTYLIHKWIAGGMGYEEVAQLASLQDAAHVERIYVATHPARSTPADAPTPAAPVAPATSQTCSYPDCHCPFDAPADPNWCARGLPRIGRARGGHIYFLVPHEGKE